MYFSGLKTDNYEKAFYTFIREKVQILSDLKIISIGNGLEKRIIDKNKFYKFQNILRIQNRLPIEEEAPEDESPMQRKFRLRRQERERAKRNSNKLTLFIAIQYYKKKGFTEEEIFYRNQINSI